MGTTRIKEGAKEDLFGSGSRLESSQGSGDKVFSGRFCGGRSRRDQRGRDNRVIVTRFQGMGINDKGIIRVFIKRDIHKVGIMGNWFSHGFSKGDILVGRGVGLGGGSRLGEMRVTGSVEPRTGAVRIGSVKATFTPGVTTMNGTNIRVVNTWRAARIVIVVGVVVVVPGGRRVG